MVKVLGAGQGIEVLLTAEVAVAAHQGVGAARRPLQPAAVLAGGAGGGAGHAVDGDVLVAAEGRLGDVAVGQRLLGGVAGRRVQALQEHLGRVLQHRVDGGRHAHLRQHREVVADLGDGRRGVAGHVAVAVVAARAEHLVGPQRRERRRRPLLGRAVAVPVEDVHAQDRLGRGRQREEAEGRREHRFQLHCCSCCCCAVVNDL